MPLEQLGPVPDRFDWKIENQFAAQQQRSGGPEAVSIVWSNRGAASDGFSAVFGSSAAAGRAVVDAVMAQWSRIITSFNRSDGTSTLQVNVSMAKDVNGNFTGGFGAAGGPEVSPPSDHKPRLGAITIGGGTLSANANDSNGWFFDPTPMDNAEFLGTVNNPFNARATNTGQGSDLFSVVNAELAHTLGLISDRNNNGGDYGAYTLEDITDVTGIMDNAEGGGVFGSFQVFNGPNIRHLMTTYNSGDPTGLSWGNVVHTAGGGNINFAGTNWIGTQDEGNAIYDGAERTMPSFVVARILSDAYNYSMVDPATFADAYTVLNTSTGVLNIRGSSSSTSSDVIIVDVSGSELVVTVDIGEDVPGSGSLPGAGNLGGWVTRVPLSSINSIVVNGGGSNDFLRIERNGGKSTTVNGDAGNDFIDFNFYNRNLSNQTGNVNVNGGSGTDSVFVYDDNVSAGQTFTITSSRFDRPGWGGFFYADDLEALTLRAGAGVDTINVRSTFANQPILIDNTASADVVNVGGSNGVQSINSDLTITNPPSFSTVNINDTGNSTARSAFVDFAGSSAYERITNLAPARVIWKTNDVSGVNITTGSGVDSLLVYSNNKPMSLNSAGGQDNVQIGDAAVGGLGFITSQINVNNTPALTNLVVTDAGNNSARNANMDFAGSNAFGRVTNLAPSPIVWNNNDINTVTIITGNANDTMLLYSNTENLRFDSAGGNDTIFMGALSVGGLQFISGLVSVDNTTGSSVVVVDDLGTSTTKTAVGITHPAGAYTQVAGFAPATLRFNDSGLSQVQIRSGNITNIQPDKFDVQATSVPLYFFNNGGNDGVTLGGGTLGADGLLAPVSIGGTPGSTSVGFADYGTAVGRTMTLDDDGSTATVSGFGPVDHTFLITTVTNLGFSLGNAADTLAILRDRKPTSISNNAAGNPTDTITVGNTTTGLADITANISQSISLSPMAFYLEDSVNTAGRTFTFQPQFFGATPTSNRILFNGTNYVEHLVDARCESVSINAGSGNDTFNVPFTRPVTYLYGNDGADAYNLGTHASQFSNPIYLYGPGGLDTLNVNADNGSTASAVLLSTMHFSNIVLGTGGSLSVAGGGDKLLYTQNLTLGTNSTIDLVDNDMIVDYTGASQLPAVQSLINAMRNGGAWNGTRGITSSYAATSTPANNTLGAMEATDYEAIYGAGALFDAEALDADMVLVKHTYYGDTDFNGSVDFDDYSRTDAGYNTGRSGWMNGDFDGNGVVDFDDYSLIDLAFNTQSGALRNARPPTHPARDDNGGQVDGGGLVFA